MLIEYIISAILSNDREILFARKLFQVSMNFEILNCRNMLHAMGTITRHSVF